MFAAPILVDPSMTNFSAWVGGNGNRIKSKMAAIYRDKRTLITMVRDQCLSYATFPTLLIFHYPLPLSCSRGNFHTNCCRPHPVRGIKLLREPCFCRLQTIIVSQERYSVGLRHTLYIIHLIETTVLHILPVVWKDGKDRHSIINLFK